MADEICEKNGKVKYDHKHQAAKAMTVRSAVGTQKRNYKIGTYLCRDCGHWHWGHMKKGKGT